VPQVKSIEGAYNAFGYPDFGWEYVAYNFKDTTGDFNHIIAQLYIRQADRAPAGRDGIIHAFFNGAGGTAYGPLPVIPVSPFTPSNAKSDPYAFSVTDATTLLKNHGLDRQRGRHRRVQERGHRDDPVRRRHSGRHQAPVPAGVQHLAGHHQRAGHRPRLAGEEGRDHDQPVVRQLQPHDRH